MNETDIIVISEKGRTESLKEAAVHYLEFVTEKIKEITVENCRDHQGPAEQAFKLLGDTIDIVRAIQRRPPS